MRRVCPSSGSLRVPYGGIEEVPDLAGDRAAIVAPYVRHSVRHAGRAPCSKYDSGANLMAFAIVAASFARASPRAGVLYTQ